MLDLSPSISIVGLRVEDRIANPSPASAEGEKAVNDEKASSSSSSTSSSLSSSSSFEEIISIDEILSPDVTSIDVADETRAHTEEGREEVDEKDKCFGPACDCPPGFEGVEPFCRPIAAEGERTPSSEGDVEVEDVSIPMAFYHKIAGIKNVEEFINVTKINVRLPFVVTDDSTTSLTTLPAEGCLPKKKCVSVRPKHRHPSEDVFPSSVDVERCGGCCGHPDLACLPWSTEPMSVKLLKYGYNPDGTISNLGFTTTSVIRELKCKCVQIQT